MKKTNFAFERQTLWRTMLAVGISASTLSYSPVWASGLAATVTSASQAGEKYEGIIVDANTRDPIIGATVMIKGTTTGVTTDMDGRFSIDAARGQTLSVSYIGYKTKEIKLSKVTLLSIELSEDAQALGEVVVTAFGVGQKKETMVGAVTQVKAGELKVPSANLSNSFVGRVSGVVAYQNSGEPGNDGSTFYIRGISTFTATSPLIIIDGVEASQGDLNALDSEVIESFSVLKDATATAMYGTRGANGVMIVKTKGGENLERAVINARVEAYVSMPSRLPEFADGASYMEMYNEAVSNLAASTSTKLYTADQIAGVRNGGDPYKYPNVDWYKEMFKDATINERANLNVRGGSSKMDYFINANVNHETGMMKARSKDFYSYDNNIDVLRYTFQSNINAHLSKTATVSMNLGVEMRDEHGPTKSSGDLFSMAMDNNPVDYPVYYPMGSSVGSMGIANEYVKWGAHGAGNADGYNPIAEMTKGYSDSFESTVRANIKYDQKLDFITKGLKFNALVSFKNWTTTTAKRERGYNRYYLGEVLGDGNYLINAYGQEGSSQLTTTEGKDGSRSFYIQAILGYDRTFNEVHNVSAMILYNQDQKNINNLKPKGDESSYTILVNSLAQRKMGVAGRISYDYAHKYMAEINVGYNGSENFAKGHRYGFFPSLALGWNVSEESWFGSLKNTVNNLKLRGSYGLVGNADAGTRFLYMAEVNLGGKQFVTGDENGTSYNTMSGPTFTRFANDKIKWEVGHKLNVGIDIGLFNALNLSLEYFHEIRSDIFMKNGTIPNYMGVAGATVYGNYGKVKNWGVELAADYGKQITKDFSVQFKGTFSFARNKVMEYAESYDPNYPNLSQIGHSLNSYKGYVYDGHLFMDKAEIANSPEQMISGNVAPGDIKYKDIPNKNGETDGKITTNDQVYMGHPYVPEIVYGFGPSFRYKQWDFSFFFQGAANVSLMIQAGSFAPFGSGINRNVLKFIEKDHWSSDNQNIHAAYPRLTQLEHGNNTAASSYWLRNAAYLKLKNAEVGYSWKFLRAYVSGSNLLTFSPFKEWDPEQGADGALKYPIQRVFNIGVQLNFK